MDEKNSTIRQLSSTEIVYYYKYLIQNTLQKGDTYEDKYNSNTKQSCS